MIVEFVVCALPILGVPLLVWLDPADLRPKPTKPANPNKES